jgi:hypothetical protein
MLQHLSCKNLSLYSLVIFKNYKLNLKFTRQAGSEIFEQLDMWIVLLLDFNRMSVGICSSTASALIGAKVQDSIVEIPSGNFHNSIAFNDGFRCFHKKSYYGHILGVQYTAETVLSRSPTSKY